MQPIPFPTNGNRYQYVSNQFAIARSPIIQFMKAQLRAAMNNYRAVLGTILMPLIVLFFLWLPMHDSDNGMAVLQGLFYGLVTFGVILGGNNFAMRLVSWRQMGIFRRLACTPAPLSHIVAGSALAQIMISLVQGVLVLVFGVLVFKLEANWLGLGGALIVLLLCAACFIAYASVIATFVRSAETANVVFILTLLPMFFLSGGMPPGVLPAWLQNAAKWSPVGVTNTLIQPLLANGRFPEHALLYMTILAGFTIGLSAIVVKKFRWQ